MISNNYSKLEPKFIARVTEKAEMECPDTALLLSSTYTKQLNDHINSVKSLSANEIEHKLDYLIGCLTITLDNPVSDLKFLRARRCEMGNKFTHIDELSYIRKITKCFPSQGRLNVIGTSLFYAAVFLKQSDEALGVILSESKSRKLDRMNVLLSQQKNNTDLNLRIIGIWDHVRCNDNLYRLRETVYSYYVNAYEFMKDKFPKDLLLAYQLTDRFLADIMSRKGSQCLYDVTAMASKLMLEGGKTDGILYSSVEAKREPVIALTSRAVDEKVEHVYVTDIKVHERWGYEFYQYTTQDKGVVDPFTGELLWEVR